MTTIDSLCSSGHVNALSSSLYLHPLPPCPHSHGPTRLAHQLSPTTYTAHAPNTTQVLIPTARSTQLLTTYILFISSSLRIHHSSVLQHPRALPLSSTTRIQNTHSSAISSIHDTVFKDPHHSHIVYSCTSVCLPVPSLRSDHNPHQIDISPFTAHCACLQPYHGCYTFTTLAE